MRGRLVLIWKWGLYNPTTRWQRQHKKKMVLEGKTTTLHVHHTLLYISLPFLHDYDVTFQGGRKQATAKFYFSF